MSMATPRHLTGLLVSCVAAVIFTSSSHAGGLFDRDAGLKDDISMEGGLKDGPAPACGRSFSANTALTSDYVFRGASQSNEHPAIQGGFDFSWCRFYAGVWASSIDFGATADIEIDYYGGIKSKLFGFDVDTGLIYYSYPDASDAPGAELDFLELKASVSRELHQNFTVTSTVFWTPDGTNEAGNTWTFETGVQRDLGQRGRYKFSASGMFGSVYNSENNPGFIAFYGDDNYHYWNVGGSVVVADKFTFDVRYHDTNVSDAATCSAGRDLCDARVVGTVSSSF